MTVSTQHLDQFFRLLHDLLAGEFSDVLFTGHRGGLPLVVRFAPVPAKFLRLRLPNDSCLHVESIAAYSGPADRRANLSADASLTMSSVFPGTELWGAARAWSDPGNAVMALHTGWGVDQWICLKFSALSSLSEVVVHNRDDRWLTRAWGSVLETSTDGQTWLQFYSHAARVKELISRLVAWAGSLQPSQEVLCMLTACQLIERLFSQDFLGAQELLSSEPRLPDELQASVKAELSRAILSWSEFEWNSHGIVRPFKYWADEEKVAYLAQAAMLARDLSALTPLVCMGFGLVLGLVRDGALIPHDDDVDLLLAFDVRSCPTITHAAQLMARHLESLGYEVSGEHFSHRWVRHATWPASLPQIDVFVGLQEGEEVSWYPSERRGLRMRDVFPPGTAKIYGVECTVPADILKYLDVTYGPYWRKVDEHFGHPWDASQYSDIA